MCHYIHLLGSLSPPRLHQCSADARDCLVGHPQPLVTPLMGLPKSKPLGPIHESSTTQMNTLQSEDNQANHHRKASHHRGEISKAKGLLLVSDGQPTHEIEQHLDPSHDFISSNFFEHLAGPISISLELKCQVRPLLTRLDSTKHEVHRHNDSVKPSAIYQP